MEMPSKALLSIEGFRGMYEYALGWALNMPLQFISPKGDGHPVMIIPGLGAADGSTHYIRNFLDEIGYGLDALLNQLVDRVSDISDASGGQEISLIGWSLGGIYAREISKIIPGKVRQVITLGTPFKGDAAGTNATFLYEILSHDKSHHDPNIVMKIGVPPPVPFTSLYSKSDGVVHWQCSIENISSIAENIEIPGASHLGLGHNPISMYVIADRLTQDKETWKPYSH
jgi:hypothetical protein